MKRFYLFRTNLTTLEDYHSITNLEEFKIKCWDFYLLQALWLLENNYFEEVVIWRLSNKPIKEIIFDIQGKKFIQRWVKSFTEVFKYPKPNMSFFRGGFPHYCEVTKVNEKFFGRKLYLAAGKRLTPLYGGKYDNILYEDERDRLSTNFIPFYKTTNSNIFKPLDTIKNYDLCIISNFTQLKYKGTDLIISKIQSFDPGQKLKICHIGNNKEVGIKLCKTANVKNVEFFGHVNRNQVNEILNRSKFGIIASNSQDGCPRVITEILTSGTPLIIKEETRLLNYYKKFGVVQFKNEENLPQVINQALDNYQKIKDDLNNNLNMFTMDTICKLNCNSWRTNNV